MAMTSRERLHRCYCHEELDRPAVYVRRGFPNDDPSYDPVRAYIDAHTDLKYLWGAHVYDAVETNSFSEDISDEWRRDVTIIHTPAGDLRSAFRSSLTGMPGFQEEYLLKTAADAERYLSMPIPVFDIDVGQQDKLLADMGDRGILDCCIGFNPGGFVVEQFGSETFAMMTVTDRDMLHALCERQMHILLEFFEVLLAAGIGPYFSMLGEELIVPPLHGPADFEDFNVRYDKPIVDRIHEAGGRMHIHSHGSIKKVFQGFLDIGADVLHPLEAPPMGDITAAEAKAMARGKLTLEGNIQIADMYEKPAEDIRRQTEVLIADAFDDRRGLIVCPTASLYQRGKGGECFEQVKAMVETVLACGT